MKKSRYGSIITAFCDEKKRENVIKTFFKHTATIGIREKKYDRHVLDRAIETVETPLGAVRKKVSSGYGVKKEKFEYDDVKTIAEEKGLGFREVLEIIKK